MKTITFDKFIAFSIEKYICKKLNGMKLMYLCTYLLTKIELHMVGPVY